MRGVLHVSTHPPPIQRAMLIKQMLSILMRDHLKAHFLPPATLIGGITQTFLGGKTSLLRVIEGNNLLPLFLKQQYYKKGKHPKTKPRETEQSTDHPQQKTTKGHKSKTKEKAPKGKANKNKSIGKKKCNILVN